VPLEAGQTLDDVPQIVREGDVWMLPTAAGSLQFETTPDGCRILP